ncbi:MAG TPA: hypothetical protein VGV62_12640 [Xanthobacteraceae bacterium]|jgi:hypothetical protein|nr:hypothetical protein [Xanthobacteraceae bacterium]
MESDEEIELAASQVAAATMAQILSDRDRLRRLWMSLNQTETVIRRGQLAYIESTNLLTRADGSGVIDEFPAAR